MPPLQGFVLSGSRYVTVSEPERMGSVLRASSPVLGLNLHLDEGVLRFYDPARQVYLLTRLEVEDRLQESEQARRTEAHARREAEARLAELEARLRASQPSPSPERPDKVSRNLRIPPVAPRKAPAVHSHVEFTGTLRACNCA